MGLVDTLLYGAPGVAQAFTAGMKGRREGLEAQAELRRKQEEDAAKRRQAEAAQQRALQQLQLDRQRLDLDRQRETRAAQPKPNRLTYMGREYDTPQEVADAKRIIEPPASQEMTPYQRAMIQIQREQNRIAELRQRASNQPKPTGPSNDFERKAAFMLPGVTDAVNTLEGFEAKGVDRIGGVPVIGNYLMRDEARVAEQAASTVADAYLRLTTGANYNRGEVEQAAKQMLPQPGDDERTLAAKQRRRQQVVEAMRAAASGNYMAVQPGLITPQQDGGFRLAPGGPAGGTQPQTYQPRYPDNPYGRR